MGFKDILVAVDTAPSATGRIEIAAALAERFGAHLVGLHTVASADAPQVCGYFERFNRPLDLFHEKFSEQMRAESATARALFEEIAAQRSLSLEWREATGFPSETTALHGRYVDLIIVGQPDPDYPQSWLFQPDAGELALAVGRPILVVPYVGKWTDIGNRVLIGWNTSRDATRAVNDAMSFLVTAESVTVLAIDPDRGPRGHGDVPGADITQHLARHGVKATIQSTVSGDISVGNALLSWASDVTADLLVMGAYGHLRERELLFGGTTRTVLHSMTLPVLMAH